MAALLSLSVVLAHPDLDRQIADISARIENDPRNVELYLQRGELHRIHRNWSDAETDFHRARKIQPDLVAVDYFLGKLHLDGERPKRAKKAFDRFLKHEPGHAKARVARARAHVQLGNASAAVEDFTIAIDSYGPDARPDPSFYLERARVLAGAGDDHFDLAVRGLDEGLERLGNPVTLQLYAIELELARGAHDAALDRLDRIASGAQRQETWLVRRGEILESAGRIGEARAAYERAMAAIDRLPASRRGNRAMLRLRSDAEAALERIGAQDESSHGG